MLIRQNVFLNPGTIHDFWAPSQKTSAVRIQSLSVYLLGDFAETFRRFAPSDGGHLLSLLCRFFSKVDINSAAPWLKHFADTCAHKDFPPLFFHVSHTDPFQIMRKSKWSRETTLRWAVAQVFGDYLGCLSIWELWRKSLFCWKRKIRSDGGIRPGSFPNLSKQLPVVWPSGSSRLFPPLRFVSMFLLVGEISWKHI